MQYLSADYLSQNLNANGYNITGAGTLSGSTGTFTTLSGTTFGGNTFNVSGSAITALNADGGGLTINSDSSVTAGTVSLLNS